MARTPALGCLIAITCTLIIEITQASQNFVLEAELQLNPADQNLLSGASGFAAETLSAILSAVPQVLHSSSSSSGSSSGDDVIYDIYVDSDDYYIDDAVYEEHLRSDEVSYPDDLLRFGIEQQQADVIVDLPYDIASANAANTADLLQLPLARMSVGMPLQTSILQPALLFANSIATKCWHSILQASPLSAMSLQNMDTRSPELGQVDMPLESDHSSSSSSSGMDGLSILSIQQQQQIEEEPADMDITISIESSTPQTVWSWLLSRFMLDSSSSSSSMTAAGLSQLMDIVQRSVAVYKDMSSVGIPGGQDTPSSMVITMESSGPYVSIPGDEDLSATAAAVAAAAVSAFGGDAEFEDDVIVDVKLTHTLDAFASSWPHLLSTGACLVVLHVLAALLVVRHVLRHRRNSRDGADDATTCSNSSMRKGQQQVQASNRKYQRHQQFIVHDGLREAGLYQKLLSEEENV